MSDVAIYVCAPLLCVYMALLCVRACILGAYTFSVCGVYKWDSNSCDCHLDKRSIVILLCV